VVGACEFLADDRLEGRDTGSEGFKKAQAYAVEQLQKAGLEPAAPTASTSPCTSTNMKSTKPNRRWPYSQMAKRKLSPSPTMLSSHPRHACLRDAFRALVLSVRVENPGEKPR